MKKVLIVLVVLLLVAVATWYLVFNKSEVVAPTTVNPTEVTNTRASSDVVVPAKQITTTTTVTVETKVKTPVILTKAVEIKNFAFTPATLNIKKGTKVTWTNNDVTAHTITADTGTQLASSAFASGESFSFVFNEVGTFDYHCSIHPTMKGKVVVTE
jgi:plastocyanin